MATFLFKLPDIGEGTTEAEIAAWHVEVGAVIREEDPLLDLTTNKATVEVTSPVHGTVVARHGAVGEVRAIGTDLLVIETGGADPAPAPSPAQEAPSRPKDTPLEDIRPAPPPLPVAAGRALAAPAVRKAARERGIDLAGVTGTGPEGRVTRADLDRHIGSAPATAEDPVTEVRIVGVRRQIAERLAEAARRIPHFSYVEEVDVTALETLRADLNAEGGPRLTLLPFLALALVKVLSGFPQINARFDDANGVLRQHGAVHLGIAAQTAAGLLVPVLRHAEALDLYGLGAGIARLADGARAGTLKPAELSGSTLTLTSLGALGGLASTPIVNAPETAIVGVNRIVERPVVRGGAVVIRKMMNLSSSFDHRIVDGFDAARFIQAVKARLEQPARLFLSPPPGRDP